MTLRRGLTYLLLVAIAIVMLLPLVWLTSTAFKSANEDIFAFPPRWLPAEPTWANFVTVWQTNPFGQYLFNSTLVAVLTVACNLLTSALAAYPLARLSFRGREVIFTAILATIMIPFQIIMIPLFILAVQLGLRNTYLGMILPSLASAFGIFLLRQAFMAVPKELEEAARLDGCSELGLWWFVMLPAIRPALVTLGIFVFIGAWSDFLWPVGLGSARTLYPAHWRGHLGGDVFFGLAAHCRWLGDFNCARVHCVYFLATIYHALPNYCWPEGLAS